MVHSGRRRCRRIRIRPHDKSDTTRHPPGPAVLARPSQSPRRRRYPGHGNRKRTPNEAGEIPRRAIAVGDSGIIIVQEGRTIGILPELGTSDFGNSPNSYSTSPGKLAWRKRAKASSSQTTAATPPPTPWPTGYSAARIPIANAGINQGCPALDSQWIRILRRNPAPPTSVARQQLLRPLRILGREDNHPARELPQQQPLPPGQNRRRLQPGKRQLPGSGHLTQTQGSSCQPRSLAQVT